MAECCTLLFGDLSLLLTITLQFWHPLSSSYTEGMFWCRNYLLFLLVSIFLIRRSLERGHIQLSLSSTAPDFFCLYVACVYVFI